MIQHLSEFSDFNQALQCADHSLPYKFESVFNADRRSSRSLSKKKFRLLLAFEGLLSKILHQGEQVFYVSYGVRSSSFEQFFLGWVMYYINRQAFIFTTKRILLIQFKGKYKPWDLIAQIPYANIRKIKQTFFGNLNIVYSNGRTSLFIGMPKYDRKNIAMIADVVREKSSDIKGTSGATENLCPHCFTIITGFPKSCSLCKKPFKSSRKAGLLSLLFPGLGDFYLGHKSFAVLEIIGAALLWVSIFIPDSETKAPITISSILITALLLILIMHGLDAFITSKIGKKGIYPGTSRT